MDFKLVSDYKPTGDQPKAIDSLVRGIEMGLDDQVLLGVTGSGKTCTMANVIAKLNRPTLVLAHNHPSGIALPSQEDIALTLRLRDALDVMDILLLDHLVIADDDYVSMNDSGYLRRGF